MEKTILIRLSSIKDELILIRAEVICDVNFSSRCVEIKQLDEMIDDATKLIKEISIKGNFESDTNDSNIQ